MSELVLLVVTVAVLALAAVGAWLALRIASSPVVVLPFESGSLVTQHAVSRYHVRWYAVTLLFLAFDMEMIFMYPWTVVVATMGTTAVVEMFLVLASLLAVVLYAWREGALRWT